MTADKPTHLVPKLRFPEFRIAQVWEQVTLSEAFKKITNGQANAQDHQEDGTYPLFDRSNVAKRSSSYLFDAEAVILPGEGREFTPRYFNGKFNLHQRAYALMEPTVEPRFAFHALDMSKRALANSAVQSTVLSLRMPIIEKFAIPCPKSHDEQQKIADCLGSLDNLIAAEGRKLEALRQHKQGLMQQLFPQAGETQPRLRFPEFQNEPEWSLEAIDEFAQTTTGKRDTQDKVDGGRYLFFVRSQSTERIDTYAYNGEAVLTSGDGVGVGKNFHYMDGKFDFHQRVYCIHQFKSHVLGRFFFFYFSEHFGPRVRRVSAKNSVDSVRQSNDH